MRQARATDRRAAAPISTAGAVPMNGNAAPWSDRKATGNAIPRDRYKALRQMRKDFLATS